MYCFTLKFIVDLECGFPASIQHGSYQLINGSKAYLSGVQYGCDPGFVLVGRALLTCDVDQRWNGPPPRCEPVLCPQPQALPNGYMRLTKQGTAAGARVHYNCLPGYELHGANNTLLCSLQGYWEGEMPNCRG